MTPPALAERTPEYHCLIDHPDARTGRATVVLPEGSSL